MTINTPHLEQMQWQYFRNDSGETVPPFAVLRVTGTTVNNSMPAITCAKPNATSYNFYFVNGPFAVRNGKFGQGTYGPHVVARYDTAATPTLDAEWGPQSGSWFLSTAGSGFRIVGEISATKFTDSGLLEAIQVPSSAAASQPDWAVLNQPSITISSGTMTTITWSGDFDSGSADLEADAAAETIELGVNGSYLNELYLHGIHNGSGADTSFRLMSTLAVAQFNGAIQNPTFNGVAFLGHDSSAPGHQYTWIWCRATLEHHRIHSQCGRR